MDANRPMDAAIPETRKVGSLTLRVRGNEATIVPDPADQGRFALEKYGSRKVAAVRYFLRYYAAFHKYGWDVVINLIADFSERSEKYDFRRVIIDNNSMRNFGTSKDRDKKSLAYRILTIGNFELVLEFLMSEVADYWLTPGILEAIGQTEHMADGLAEVLEGPHKGSSAMCAATFGGSYHSRELRKGRDCLIEFHLIAVPGDRVCRVVSLTMPAPVEQGVNRQTYTPAEQVIEMRGEAICGHGWLVGTKVGPKFGLMLEGRLKQPVSLQITAIAEPETGRELKARDIVVLWTDDNDTFDASGVRGARGVRTKAIGPQIAKLAESETIIDAVCENIRHRVHYMSLITTKY